MPSDFHQHMRAGSTTAKGWLGFSGQHTNPVRAARRRQIKAYGGIRQYKIARRVERAFTEVRVLS